MWQDESIIQQITVCDFFRGHLTHCFTKFEKRKIPFRLVNIQLECKGTLKHVYKNQIDDFHFIISIGIYLNLIKRPIEPHMRNNPA